MTLADKQPGPFALEMDSIRAYRAGEARTVAATSNDLGTVASDAGLTTLLDLVKLSGISDALPANERLTVFAPTNQAFLDLLAVLGISKQQLFEDRGLLLTVLLYHIVNEELFAEDVLAADEIFPAESEPIAVDAKNGKLNDSKIILTDQDASNGVVHLIDAVLVPPAALELLE